VRCPRCESAALDERDRDGIVVDVCPSCRGVWLDRGELEKLIARATREIDELSRPRDRAADSDRSPVYGGRPPDSDRHPGHGHGQHYPKRKKHWMEKLGDIFD
jgi:uncharacterized protein